MKSFRFIFFLTVLTAFNLGATLNASAKDDWLGIQSKNFELVGNANAAELNRAAAALERFAAVFSRLFPAVKFGAPVPTRVVVFRDRKSFESFKPFGSAERRRSAGSGYFQPGEEINYIAISAEDARADAYRAIFHDYTHFLLENSIGRSVLPPWFNEGIAEYAGQVTFDENHRATLGSPSEEHLTTLDENRLMLLEKLFEQDYYSLQSQNRETSALFQAQSWALVHYFLSDEKRIEQFRHFVELLREGKNQQRAFAKAFEIDYRTAENELKQYLKQKQPIVKTAEKIDLSQTLPARAVTETEAGAILGDLLYRVGRFTESEKHLLGILKPGVVSSDSEITLGYLKMRERNFAEAKAHLENALKSAPGDYRAHYGAALVSGREDMVGFGFVSGYSTAQAAKIREHLRQAIKLNPDFAESYHLLAFVNFVRNEQVDEGLAMIDRALQAAPGNQWYLLRKAQLLTRKEKFTEARQIMLRIIPTAPDDRLKVYAENSLTVMNSLEAQLLSLKNPRYKIPDDGVITDEPVSEEELRRRREKAMIESLNLALRIPDASERRVLGTVTGIECRPGSIIVSVKTETESLRLRADSFNDLILTAYDNEQVSSQFGCGVLKKEGFSVITYRPPVDQNSKETGELVAVEFVPKYFKFVGQK